MAGLPVIAAKPNAAIAARFRNGYQDVLRMVFSLGMLVVCR
jgi:hypothetical protein